MRPLLLTPTFLVDEAEKLSGRHADRDLISMLNAGHRRGATVQRCFESGGDYAVREFDAFGFRALAAIRRLWDTVLAFTELTLSSSWPTKSTAASSAPQTLPTW